MNFFRPKIAPPGWRYFLRATRQPIPGKPAASFDFATQAELDEFLKGEPLTRWNCLSLLERKSDNQTLP